MDDLDAVAPRHDGKRTDIFLANRQIDGGPVAADAGRGRNTQPAESPRPAFDCVDPKRQGQAHAGCLADRLFARPATHGGELASWNGAQGSDFIRMKRRSDVIDVRNAVRRLDINANMGLRRHGDPDLVAGMADVTSDRAVLGQGLAPGVGANHVLRVHAAKTNGGLTEHGAAEEIAHLVLGAQKPRGTGMLIGKRVPHRMAKQRVLLPPVDGQTNAQRGVFHERRKFDIEKGIRTGPAFLRRYKGGEGWH